ncbi:hypothetical protein ACR9YC_07105 [Parasphingorhabdus sp. DH2-15]|uniref:hypothetical protein n=1 Tax=Parasphingorhabdus sp. DH2-15 TaxID=3444112 RepID=UPI003F684B93
MEDVTGSTDEVYSESLNICVWNESNAGMGPLYRLKHEMVFVYKVGDAPHINNVELGKHGRYRTNIWDYPSVVTIREDGRTRRVTAAEAFILQLTQKGSADWSRCVNQAQSMKVLPRKLVMMLRATVQIMMLPVPMDRAQMAA